jgi:hypothetical protein
MQTGHVHRGALWHAADMFKHESFFAFYKGMASPLVANFLLNSILFYSYDMSKRYLDVSTWTSSLTRL